ncbi:hypothetical protein [Antrihabitans sp. YC2-6]|uniref:hypothetical protein n=1 Tax=Antrihabitans sp. YC2-6 TaxID=2799498 RepID=UPI0018F62B15|nr:hypothetical protein [Antrihabitans sp. YC2-6]MBJ8345499.1 hypothetical protein [Antrihabitans sp. YC2-6]
MTDLANARLELLARFRDMYQRCRFDLDLFDVDAGYLQTTLSDDARMPLRFFVEYNNVWWFAIISGVDVPSIGYDAESDSGSIVLDIRYGDDVLRAMQHVHFGDGVINRIRTYASSSFFAGPSPLVRLDARGNAVWLETGYDLETSRQAAEVFLATPLGTYFAELPATAAAVERIQVNLADLRDRS